MILLLSSVIKAKECARAVEQASHEPVELCAAVQEAIEKLQAQEFSVVILDQLVLDSELEQEEAICKHLGSATPIYVNFAIAGVERIVRELRRALHRRKQELEAARKDAVRVLRQEMNDILTAILLSCQMALKIPELPQQAETKMQELELLATQLNAKLGAACVG